MVNWWVLVLVAIGKPVAPERRGCSAVYSRYTLSHTHTRTHARRQPGSSRCVGLVCVCARWWYERRVVRGLYTIVNPISTHARVVPPRCLLQCQHQHRRFHHYREGYSLHPRGQCRGEPSRARGVAIALLGSAS